jgi:hypothetical protein
LQDLVGTDFHVDHTAIDTAHPQVVGIRRVGRITGAGNGVVARIRDEMTAA